MIKDAHEQRRPFRIATPRKVTQFWISGADTTITTSQTVNLAAFSFARFLLIGGGGGGSTASVASTLGYIAATSGGSPTLALQAETFGCGGGSGASMYLDIDLARLPSKSISIVIGTGGGSGNPGTSGTATTISSSLLIASAGGGGGGGYGTTASGSGGIAAINTVFGGAILDLNMADGEIGHPQLFRIGTIYPARNNAVPIHAHITAGYGGLGGSGATAGSAGRVVYWAA